MKWQERKGIESPLFISPDAGGDKEVGYPFVDYSSLHLDRCQLFLAALNNA